MISLSSPNANCYANPVPLPSSTLPTGQPTVVEYSTRRPARYKAYAVAFSSLLSVCRQFFLTSKSSRTESVRVETRLARGNFHIPLTHVGHSRCDRFGSPQLEHELMSVASCKALPAIRLDRPFMWETFFFGTARRMDSQISPSREDTVEETVAPKY